MKKKLFDYGFNFVAIAALVLFCLSVWYDRSRPIFLCFVAMMTVALFGTLRIIFLENLDVKLLQEVQNASKEK